MLIIYDDIPMQFGFLANLVKVFPSLAKRPLHLTGESYAGTYIVSVGMYLTTNIC
jgi:carboxypeptidase C (cathepsin A)